MSLGQIKSSAESNLSTNKEQNEGLKKPITVQTRQKIDLLLHKNPTWIRIARLLYRNNYNKAYGFLKDLAQIDPDSTDAEKTDMLLNIIGEYSDHTEAHSRQIRNIFENMEKFKDLQKLESFKNMDFKSLATAMERHDVGKISMSEDVLHKHGMYNERDIFIKETHPLVGHLILRALDFDEKSVRLALTHHLKYETAANGSLSIIGYPKKAFLRYCKETGQTAELSSEDQLAGFADVFSALMDINRPTDVYGTHDTKISEPERCKKAFEVMDNKIFNDPYYIKGEGASLYSAFKNAMLKTSVKTEDLRIAA